MEHSPRFRLSKGGFKICLIRWLEGHKDWYLTLTYSNLRTGSRMGSRYRVEGRALIFSCQSTKIAISRWTTFDKKTLEPTKKRHSTSEDKGEATHTHTNNRRGTIMINQILYPLGGRLTNWRTITPKKFSQFCEGSRLHISLRSLGIQPRNWESPGNLTLKVRGIWLQDFLRTGGNRHSWRAQSKSCAHQDPGERNSDPTGYRIRPASECLRVSCRGVGR